MKKIAVIEKIHSDGLELLKKNQDYEYELITDVSEENLIKKLPEFDACTLRVSTLNENILKHCPKLKVISRHGVGYDNVDLNYIKKKKYFTSYNSNCKRSSSGRACYLYDVVYLKKYKSIRQ